MLQIRAGYIRFDGEPDYGKSWSRGNLEDALCVDVAALFAAAILRRNPESVVVPFDTHAYEAKLDPIDSNLSLSERLAKYGGGGTDCSLPLQTANTRFSKRKFAGVVLVSDIRGILTEIIRKFASDWWRPKRGVDAKCVLVHPCFVHTWRGKTARFQGGKRHDCPRLIVPVNQLLKMKSCRFTA